ncbi:MAG: sigma-54-dependent Fis family transcriptional regulator [Candidatus Marinimicrobia bacterium]|nr:sigma-54-dependent Fis family transcriptional regulator [Candidatus Neomarinimicrobiota bacterium]
MIDIDKIQKSVGIIGESEEMRDMLHLIGQVAPTEISVLINGDSGSGKEMVAKAIHKNSRRKFEPYIIVNCGAIPAGIIESELFGHKKGSFTGAGEDRKGYFESAHKGTIFLDEIGETPLETQAKLLRVIENGEFIRVGDTKTQRVDVRVVAVTNRDLAEEVNNGSFRKDLYFRLKTITIRVPSLKEHFSDLHLYVERFGLEFSAKNDISFKGFGSDAFQVMKKYHWPGNVRELKNFVESLLVIQMGQRITGEMVTKALGLAGSDLKNPNLPVFIDRESDDVERELILRQLLFIRQEINEIKQIIQGGGKITPQSQSEQPMNSALYLPANIPLDSQVNPSEIMDIESGRISAIDPDSIGDVSMKDVEHELIESTLTKLNHNRRKTARALGLSERTLYRKIKEYNIIKK